MKYSYQWLQELSGTTKTPEELAEFLTLRAFEVEGVESVGFDIDHVVVGEVVGLEKHPDADRLRVAQINIGDEVLTIVCGAPNIAIGQKVPVALVGAVLPGNFEIKQSKIRGVASSGMVCSPKELGLGDSHEGIMVLPESYVLGKLLRDVLKDKDYLLDIKVLPDRAHDALSHVGMAREIAALEGGELDYDYEGLVLESKSSKAMNISIAPETGSRRYIGALIRNIEVKPSPGWLRNRLQSFGMRSINNIVDVTNYVMLELGYPLHAFDADHLEGNSGKTLKVGVRSAHDGEIITLLDGREYLLQKNDVVITDSHKALALAGIMGGSDTGVTPETKNIFLEGAHFDPVAIRKTRTRLRLRTDASDRFEKGLDPNLAEKAVVRALELIAHVAGGSVADVADRYPSPVELKQLTLSAEHIVRMLGVEVDHEMVVTALERLGFSVKYTGKEYALTVPSWRLDVESPEDVIEDIGKMIGYDAVPAIAPQVSLSGVVLDKAQRAERRLKDILADHGFTETLDYSFYGQQDAQAIGVDESSHVVLANPMNPDQALMRVSLLPHLLKNIRENLKYFKALRLFEYGRVYFPEKTGGADEAVMGAGIMVLDATNEKDAKTFFALKSLTERILGSMGVRCVFDTAENIEEFWHPTRVADIICDPDEKGSVFIGRVGEINPLVLERFRIKKRVAYVEWNHEVLVEALPKDRVFTPLRRYPTVLRDISLFVPEKVRVKDIKDTIMVSGGQFVVDVELFDRYFDASKNMKSLAFHMYFGDAERTLSGEEADALLETIASALGKKWGTERRM